MPRIAQMVLFFAVLVAGFVLGAPYSGSAELFGVVLTWSIVSATLAYVLPWVYFRLKPPRAPEDD